MNRRRQPAVFAFVGMPRRAMRARLVGHRFCPSPLGIVPAARFFHLWRVATDNAHELLLCRYPISFARYLSFLTVFAFVGMARQPMRAQMVAIHYFPNPPCSFPTEC